MPDNAVRENFKKMNFPRMTKLAPLFTQYHASNLFYKNLFGPGDPCVGGRYTKADLDFYIKTVWRDGPERAFYDIYKSEILDAVDGDKSFFSELELKTCPDLIQMEYMLYSKPFKEAFSNLDNYVLGKVEKEQKDTEKLGACDQRSSNAIIQGTSCFALYLHPELAETIKYMTKNSQLTPSMQDALTKGQQAQQRMNQHMVAAHQGK